jgi:hypothetical protein
MIKPRQIKRPGFFVFSKFFLSSSIFFTGSEKELFKIFYGRWPIKKFGPVRNKTVMMKKITLKTGFLNKREIVLIEFPFDRVIDCVKSIPGIAWKRWRYFLI